jgi:hypothetical protein
MVRYVFVAFNVMRGESPNRLTSSRIVGLYFVEDSRVVIMERMNFKRCTDSLTPALGQIRSTRTPHTNGREIFNLHDFVGRYRMDPLTVIQQRRQALFPELVR